MEELRKYVLPMGVKILRSAWLVTPTPAHLSAQEKENHARDDVEEEHLPHHPQHDEQEVEEKLPGKRILTE